MVNRGVPQGITFGDIWHQPALPSAVGDYRYVEPITDKQAEELSAEWQMIRGEIGQADDCTTSVKTLLHDGAYAVQYRLASGRHFVQTNEDTRSMLFSEILGVSVGIDRGDLGSLDGATITDVVIPDKDFTDDQLSKLRQVIDFVPHKGSVRDLSYYLGEAGLKIRSTEDESEKTITTELREALDESVLSTDELLKIIVNYARINTAKAYDRHGRCEWFYEDFLDGMSGTLMGAIGMDGQKALERRFKLLSIQQFDPLAEAVRPSFDDSMLTERGAVLGRYYNADHIIRFSAVADRFDAIHTEYHEGVHATAADTWLLSEGSEVDKPDSLQIAQGYAYRDGVNQLGRGLNEGYADHQARQKTASHLGKYQQYCGTFYETYVSSYNCAAIENPRLGAAAQTLYYAGLTDIRDIDTIRELDETFEQVYSLQTSKELET